MEEYNNTLLTEITREEAESVPGRGGEGNVSSSKKSVSDGSTESDQQKEVLVAKETKAGKVRKWAWIRLSLSAIESTMSLHIKEREYER